jgi:flagellar biosynthesis/type III secretory pathway protein FliH
MMAKTAEQTEETTGMELVEEAVPAGTQRGTSSKYRQILNDFNASGFESARVQSDANVSTLYQQLTKAIKANAEAYSGIKASKREGVVFLIHV